MFSTSGFFQFLLSPLGLLAAIVWFFWIVQFFQRLAAASTLAQLPNLKAGDQRRFGLPPQNLFEYRGAAGWQRIKKKERGSLIYDAPTEARRIAAYEERKKRLFVISKFVVVTAAVITFVSVLIAPLPLSTFLHIFRLDTILSLYEASFLNISGFIGWLFGISHDSPWMYLIYYLLLGSILSFPLVVLRFWSSAIGVSQTLTAISNETLYMLGVQWIRGAKVFDAKPGELLSDSPRQDYHYGTDDSRSKSSSKAKQKQEDKKDRRPPDDDDPFGSSQSSRAEQQTRQRDPARNYEDAVSFFGLDQATFTLDELQAVYKKKMMAHHPDRWGEISDDIRSRLENDLKTINAARDLIKKTKGWK